MEEKLQILKVYYCQYSRPAVNFENKTDKNEKDETKIHSKI